MKKKYLVITLKAGRQIKRELPHDMRIPIGATCMHDEFQKLAHTVANMGCLDSENSNAERLVYIAPAMINTVEVISE